MIGCWLSHYTLWEHIVKNGLSNVLVLEDDAAPTDDFNIKLQNTLDVLPVDYDMLYIGCIGSCTTSGELVANVMGLSNLNVYKQNGVVIPNLIIPSMPFATHAYILSNKGASQLLHAPFFKKVHYHLDFALCFFFKTNPQFKVYALRETIVNQVDNGKSDISSNEHPFLSKIFNKIPLGNNFSVGTLLNTPFFYIRKWGIPITGYTCLFALSSLAVGSCLDAKAIAIHLSIIVLVGIIDVLNYKKTPRTATLDLFVAIMFVCIGKYFSK